MPRPAPNDGVTALYRPDCKQLFVVFQGGVGSLMMRPAEFISESGLIDRNLVMFRNRRLTWFLHDVAANLPDADAVVDYVNGMRKMMRATELYCLGTCMGAWAALYFGHRLKCDTVWAFAPAPPDAARCLALAAQGKTPPELPETLAHSNGVTQFRVFYCKDAEDRHFASRLVDCPGVQLTAVEGETHRVLAVLKDQGHLQRMFPPIC